MELFSNFALTPLNGGIDNSTTSIVVTDASLFPAVTVPGSDQYSIRIENEILTVTNINISTNTLTVTRGAEGTTPDTHSDGIIVALVLTERSINQYRADNINLGSITSANVTPRKSGRLLLSTDDFSAQADKGTTLYGIHPHYNLTPFDGTGWTWFNQGTSTSDTTKGYLYFEIPPLSTDIHRGFEKSLPSLPFKWKILAKPLFHSVNFCGCGIGLYESATGKVETIHFIHSNNPLIEQNKWNSRTSYNSTRSSFNCLTGMSWPSWLSIEMDNSNNILYRCSWDGFNFNTLVATTKTNFFTTGPDRLQIFCNSVNTTWKTGISVLASKIY